MSLLKQKKHPEQAFRTCAGIHRIASTITKEHMEEACTQAMAQNINSYAYFSKVLENHKSPEPIIHENLWGKDYFKKAYHA